MKLNKENIIEIAKLTDGNFLIKTVICENIENGIEEYSEQTQAITGETDNETLKKLLEAIAEECGYCYDKYGKENLEINFKKKGRKIE